MLKYQSWVLRLAILAGAILGLAIWSVSRLAIANYLGSEVAGQVAQWVIAVAFVASGGLLGRIASVLVLASIRRNR